MVVASVVLLGALGARTSTAQTEDTKACIAAHEQSQPHRVAGRLRAARESLLVCSREVCPSLVRRDCASWLSEVEVAIPSVVVVIRSPDGQVLTDARVLVDGDVVRRQIDGKAMPVDPGERRFRFEAADGRSAELVTVIVQGEKGRVISAALPTPAGRTLPPTAELRVSSEASRPKSLAPIALGALSAIGIGSFAYFALTGLERERELRSGCAPHCAPGDVAGASHRYLVADISLGVAVVALGGALWLALRPTDSARRAAMPLALGR